MKEIDEFNSWYDSYETRPPKSSIHGFMVRVLGRKLKSQKAEFKKKIEGKRGKCDCPKKLFPKMSDFPNKDGICSGCERFVIEEGCTCNMVDISDILKEL